MNSAVSGMKDMDMNNTIQDEVFGEITFDGLNWIKTETLSLFVAGREQEFKVEIQSPDLVYDWARLGRLKKETADKIFDPDLGGIHYTTSRLRAMKDRYSRTFLKCRNSTEHNIRRAVLRKLAESEGDNFPASSVEEKLSLIHTVIARVFDDRIEIKFSCDWMEPRIGCFVIPDEGEISISPVNMDMEKLKDSIHALGFEIKECKFQCFYVYSADIPTKEQIRGILDLFTGNEEMTFWNYYHRGGVEPGSYIDIQVYNGKPYIKESTHGCGGNYKDVDMDVLLEFIIRNWDKDSDWGKYDHAVTIQPTKLEYLLRDINRSKIDVFIPDYSETPSW